MNRLATRATTLLLAALGAGWYMLKSNGGDTIGSGPVTERPQALTDPAPDAFRRQASGQLLEVFGTVERILADDRDGSPHQRFIIRTSGGVTLLVAHNLDLAPRLQGLAAGENVHVLGEYEWNEKGGLLHWTHDDPEGRHPAGYVEWRGRRYQ